MKSFWQAIKMLQSKKCIATRSDVTFGWGQEGKWFENKQPDQFKGFHALQQESRLRKLINYRENARANLRSLHNALRFHKTQAEKYLYEYMLMRQDRDALQNELKKVAHPCPHCRGRGYVNE